MDREQILTEYDGVYFDPNSWDYYLFVPGDDDVSVMDRILGAEVARFTYDEFEKIMQLDDLIEIDETAANDPLRYLYKAIDQAVWSEDSSMLYSEEGEFAWRYVQYHLARLGLTNI